MVNHGLKRQWYELFRFLSSSMPLIKCGRSEPQLGGTGVAEGTVNPSGKIRLPLILEEVFISLYFEFFLRQLLRDRSGSLPSCFSGFTSQTCYCTSLCEGLCCLDFILYVFALRLFKVLFIPRHKI